MGLEYHVIEQRENCKAGSKLFPSEEIFFHENGKCEIGGLNEECYATLQQADVCLLIGALQYFPQYTTLLNRIGQAGIKYVYITRTIINSNVNTFYTRQYIASNIGAYRDIIIGDTPVAVINRAELNQCMNELGYTRGLDLFQVDYSEQFNNFVNPYNKVEYRNMLYMLKAAFD